MKFIREIISGKHDDSGGPGSVPGTPRPEGREPDAGQIRSSGKAALDLDRYSVAGDAMDEPEAPVSDFTDDDEIHRLISDAARLHRSGTPEMAHDPAPPIEAPAAPPPLEGTEDGFHDDYRRAGLGAGEDENDNFERDEAASTVIPAMPGAMRPPLRATDAAAPEAVRHQPRAAGDVAHDANSAAAGAGMAKDMPQTTTPDAMASCPPEPALAPQDREVRAPLPPDRDARASAAPDSDVQARPVTSLGEYRTDPFARLERQADAAPSPEGRLLFHRARDGQSEAPARDPGPGTPPVAGAVTPGRPRTRLSDNMTMPSAASLEMPAPAAGRAARHAPRVKTRLLGFGGGSDSNPFDSAAQSAPAAQSLYPVGWMVVAAGPGRGNAFALYHGVSQIGRGEDQAVRLDFGDTSISRSNHAAVAYDKTQQKFYLGHGGKANLVRLNGKPVLSTEELETGSAISIGETTLHFVALCGAGFDWDESRDDDTDTAIFG